MSQKSKRSKIKCLCEFVRKGDADGVSSLIGEVGNLNNHLLSQLLDSASTPKIATILIEKGGANPNALWKKMTMLQKPEPGEMFNERSFEIQRAQG